MKYCPYLDHYLPESEFGICRDRRDGLNLYCRSCIREKVRLHRARKREYRARVKRKPCKPAQPVWRLKLEAKDAVRTAMSRGAKTQDEIKRMTRLDWDTLTDYLAEFYDQNLLCRQSLKRREYRLIA